MTRTRKPPVPAQPRPARALAPGSGGMSSLWSAVGVLAVLAPTLARTPQTGDGAEIVATALRGGVLHPPGFPLQAWLDRAVVHIPGIEPALAIALLGLAAHAAACFLVAETLRLIGVGGLGRVMAVAAFALYPPGWSLAVQPEVFSLAHGLLAGILYLTVRIRATPSGTPSPAALVTLGLLGSLGAAQHPIALTALAALAAGARAGLRPGPRRGARALVLTLALVLPAAALYLSLPLLRTASPWPDWGLLRTPADVLRHVMRQDYGTFSLSAASGPSMVSGLGVWIEDVARGWHVASLLAVLGLIELLRRPRLRPSLVPIAGTAVAGLALLALSRLPAQSYTAAVLGHVQGPMTLAGSLLIGVGTQAVWSLRTTAAWRNVLAGLVAVAIGAWLALGWPEADVSADRTLELYARGIARELPDDAVYVTEGDVETFLGVPVGGGVRFPVSQPVASLRWYAERTAPRLEPRVLGPGTILDDWASFLAACRSRGLPVASSSMTLIATPAGVPELRGLLYVARAGSQQELTPGTIAAAIRLAPLADQLPVLPRRGHAFSRFYVRRFARAYAGAAEALRRLGAPEPAARADSIALALDHGDPRRHRSRLLAAFVEDCRGRGFPLEPLARSTGKR